MALRPNLKGQDTEQNAVYNNWASQVNTVAPLLGATTTVHFQMLKGDFTLNQNDTSDTTLQHTHTHTPAWCSSSADNEVRMTRGYEWL